MNEHAYEDDTMDGHPIMPLFVATSMSGCCCSGESLPMHPFAPECSALDRQEGGSHYKDCAIQPIEYIHRNGLGFIEGNIVKYITRWRNKGGIADLRKVIHYAEMLIEMEMKHS